ncbi:hypothetical protein SPHINGOAX6_50249 [Sphingomonas sp. AX6]|nr:hypothetical protein SPHINGOAX6_50249 [Sphingomonas sp. AX6]
MGRCLLRLASARWWPRLRPNGKDRPPFGDRPSRLRIRYTKEALCALAAAAAATRRVAAVDGTTGQGTHGTAEYGADQAVTAACDLVAQEAACDCTDHGATVAVLAALVVLVAAFVPVIPVVVTTVATIALVIVTIAGRAGHCGEACGLSRCSRYGERSGTHRERGANERELVQHVISPRFSRFDFVPAPGPPGVDKRLYGRVALSRC